MKVLAIGVVCAQALGLAFSGPAASAEVSAGYAVERISDASGRPIQIDVWYPTAASEASFNYNFGMGRVAKDADVAGEKLPVILLSHGAMGAASNYSWIAEPLARDGFVVLGVSHFGESPVFGPGNVSPASVSRFGDRTRDVNAAPTYLIERSHFAALVDASRIGAIGHSSGGSTVLMLGGARFSPSDMQTYCLSARAQDKGCQYPPASAAEEQAPAPSPIKLQAIVTLDPAVGPGLTAASLAALKTPTLIVGSVHDDFLPYAAHAGRIASLLPSVETLKLSGQEGHFVYVDSCSLPVKVMGVSLCSDAISVDREKTHATLAPAVQDFFQRNLAKIDGQ